MGELLVAESSGLSIRAFSHSSRWLAAVCENSVIRSIVNGSFANLLRMCSGKFAADRQRQIRDAL